MVEFNLARPGRRNLHNLSIGVRALILIQDNPATIFTIANTGAMLTVHAATDDVFHLDTPGISTMHSVQFRRCNVPSNRDHLNIRKLSLFCPFDSTWKARGLSARGGAPPLLRI